jgi:hypothetical protein
MNGEQFLQLLERQQLVPEHLIEKLRWQISRSKWNVTATAVAKLLVDANHLTAYQARLLIGGAGITPKPGENALEDITLDCATEDFQLAPLEDEEEQQTGPTVKPSEVVPPPIQEPSPLSAGLKPLENTLEDLLSESAAIEANAPLINMGRRKLLSRKATTWLTVGMLALIVLIYFLFRDHGP